MKKNYKELKNEIIEILEKNKHWVLSTAANGNISSRSMSIINKGLDIYFQTNKCYIKYIQMQENKNVALCFNNISIEGIAEEIGDWSDEKNRDLMDLYKDAHHGSFNAYGLLEGQIVYKVKPKKIKIWKYVNGKAIRQNMYIDDEIAEELDFM